MNIVSCITFTIMKYQIRAASPEDLSAIMEILNYEILNTSSNYDETPKTLQEMEIWFEDKIKNNYPVLVAVQDGKVAAYATYGRFRNKYGYRFSAEHSVYVAKAHRASGIGTELFKVLIQKAKEQNYHSLIAGIDASNKGSIRFHEKFGFKEVGRIPESAYKFGKWLDLIFMQKMLSD